MRFQSGDVVIRQGDEPDRFYIVADGEVDVVQHRVEGTDVLVATLHRGEVFGEKESSKKHGAPPMYGRVPTSKCWRWTGGTSRTCSTLQIPQPEISCKSSSNAERRCRHSITQWGPQVRTITGELLLFSLDHALANNFDAATMSAIGPKRTWSTPPSHSILPLRWLVLTLGGPVMRRREFITLFGSAVAWRSNRRCR